MHDDLTHYLRHYVTDDGAAPRRQRGKSTAKAKAETIARRRARAYKRGQMTTTRSGR